MKIGLNGWFLTKPQTGIGVYTTQLLRAMAHATPTTEWWVPVPSAFSSADTFPDNVHLVVVPQKKWIPTASLRKGFWEHVQVPRFFKRQGVELAHYPYPSNPHRLAQSAPKTVVTVHDVIPWTDPAYRQRRRSRTYHDAALKALRHADRIVCVSQATADGLTDLLPNFPLPRIEVIHEASVPPSISTSPSSLKQAPRSARKSRSSKGGSKSGSSSKKEPQRPYLLYVGGYDVRKNVLRLVEAFEEYVGHRYAIDLHLVGAKAQDNPHYTALPTLLEKIKSLPRMKGKIRLTPSLSASALDEAYRGALALVHPSLAEGFNLPVLEAATHGVPLLLSDLPIHREIVGGNALYFDPQSTKSLGEVLLNFLYEEDLRLRLSAAARQVSATYTWDKTAQKTLDAYQKTLTR